MINELSSSQREHNNGSSHAALRAAWRLDDRGQLEISWTTEEPADRSSRKLNDAGRQFSELLVSLNVGRVKMDDYRAAADKLQ